MNICNNRDESQKHFAGAKKPISKVYIMDNYIYMTYWRSHNYRYRSQISGCQGWGWGRFEGKGVAV